MASRSVSVRNDGTDGETDPPPMEASASSTESPEHNTVLNEDEAPHTKESENRRRTSDLEKRSLEQEDADDVYNPLDKHLPLLLRPVKGRHPGGGQAGWMPDKNMASRWMGIFYDASTREIRDHLSPQFEFGLTRKLHTVASSRLWPP